MSKCEVFTACHKKARDHEKQIAMVGDVMTRCVFCGRPLKHRAGHFGGGGVTYCGHSFSRCVSIDSVVPPGAVCAASPPTGRLPLPLLERPILYNIINPFQSERGAAGGEAGGGGPQAWSDWRFSSLTHSAKRASAEMSARDIVFFWCELVKVPCSTSYDAYLGIPTFF